MSWKLYYPFDQSLIGHAFLLRDGSEPMLGPLKTIAGDPVEDDELACKHYVDQAFTGVVVLLGAINGSTGNVRYVDGTQGSLVNAATVPNNYVICEVAGIVHAEGPNAGEAMAVGDWLYSNGTVWSLLAVGGDGAGIPAPEAWVDLPVIGASWNQPVRLQARRWLGGQMGSIRGQVSLIAPGGIAVAAGLDVVAAGGVPANVRPAQSIAHAAACANPAILTSMFVGTSGVVSVAAVGTAMPQGTIVYLYMDYPLS